MIVQYRVLQCITRDLPQCPLWVLARAVEQPKRTCLARRNIKARNEGRLAMKYGDLKMDAFFYLKRIEKHVILMYEKHEIAKD